jgi:hypothetical protein
VLEEDGIHVTIEDWKIAGGQNLSGFAVNHSQSVTIFVVLAGVSTAKC